MPVVLIADDSSRDVQSAEYWSAGFFKDCPERSPGIVVANGSHVDLFPITTSYYVHPDCGTGPDEHDAALLYGGNMSALVAVYKPLLDQLSTLLGCCSVPLCSKFGISGNCTLSELPSNFTGVGFQGLYTGPLNAGGSLAESLLLQGLSGLDIGWGQVSLAEVRPDLARGGTAASRARCATRPLCVPCVCRRRRSTACTSRPCRSAPHSTCRSPSDHFHLVQEPRDS